MSNISTDSIYYSNLASTAASNASNTKALESTLNNLSTTGTGSEEDEKLLEVCKSFESYFVEQVFKEVQKTIHTDDEENDYIQYFGDMMVQELTGTVTESTDLGIAKMLYESMKRNG